MGRAKDALTSAISILNQNQKAKEMVEAIPKVICFDLEGEEEPFYVVVEGKQLNLTEAISGEPDIIVSGDAEEVAKIASREREITHPIAEGKISITKGKLSQMIVFDRVLSFRRREKGIIST